MKEKRPPSRYEVIFMHNVAWLRATSGLTQKKMSEIMGISVSTLRKIERGEMPPQTDVLVLLRLRSYFNVSCDTLLQIRLDEKSAPISTKQG